MNQPDTGNWFTFLKIIEDFALLFLAASTGDGRLFDPGVDACPTHLIVRFFTLYRNLQATFCLFHLVGIEGGDETFDFEVGQFEFFFCHDFENLIWWKNDCRSWR